MKGLPKFNSSNRLTRFIPNSEPYKFRVQGLAGPRVNPTIPETRTACFGQLYLRFGARFATPMDERLRSQMRALGHDLSSLEFSAAVANAFMKAVDDESEYEVTLMRSAFIEGHIPYIYPGVKGMRLRKTTCKPGPPDRERCAKAFRDMMVDFNKWHARTLSPANKIEEKAFDYEMEEEPTSEEDDMPEQWAEYEEPISEKERRAIDREVKALASLTTEVSSDEDSMSDTWY